MNHQQVKALAAIHYQQPPLGVSARAMEEIYRLGYVHETAEGWRSTTAGRIALAEAQQGDRT